MIPEQRYAIQPGFLGSGKRVTVAPAVDLYTGSPIAVKIRSRKDVDEENFKREIEMLGRLVNLPPSSIARFCSLQDHWTTRDQIFMAFDRYGDNLETTLQNPRLSMLPLFHVKEIARQLLQAIRYLHDNGIVHTDLKPSKIVFVSNETVKHRFYGMDNIFHHRTILKTAEIRILDFGGGHRLTSEPHQSGMIGSAGFRAPDVIMEWPLTETVDHFALGCIIAQMLTSKPLLPTLAGSKIEEVAFMDKILGPFPDNLTKTVQKDMLPAFDHRNNWGSSTFSDTKQQQLKNAKTVSEQIEDRDAAKLIRMLTNVDATKRGDLHHHEKCKFVATYEM